MGSKLAMRLHIPPRHRFKWSKRLDARCKLQCPKVMNFPDMHRQRSIVIAVSINSMAAVGLLLQCVPKVGGALTSRLLLALQPSVAPLLSENPHASSLENGSLPCDPKYRSLRAQGCTSAEQYAIISSLSCARAACVCARARVLRQKASLSACDCTQSTHLASQQHPTALQ